MNLIGLSAALSTFLGIWFGHVAVRKIEYHAPILWLPSLIAGLLGLGCEFLSLTSAIPFSNVALGIIGITFLWDAVEFWRQERRVRRGHAPANPRNPRHAVFIIAGCAITSNPLEIKGDKL